ncbi:extracellular solute-binding protein [Phytohabitans sp. ZYX-F-186]|uniref:Extracellular solute-binding protein n=1 Tax=Phytohabitans maris TaxID=3071409 RepID=A0ABU0ZBE4_9ACTN|nr:extracellular solute-binding protein [Phytohabitans sp. ZYX-F-186]MDQ7903650.1 extracellular solute-binding protein [Phytohabitans sp. ZYX-F-186]
MPIHPHRRGRGRGLRAALAAGAALALALTGCSSDEPAESSGGLSGKIVWADFGGPTNKARYATYFDDFTKQTGVEVVSEVESDAVANTMLTGGKGDYDAIHVGLDTVYRHKDNIAPLDAAVGRDTNLPENIRDYAFGTFYVGHVQAYLTATFPNGGPQTWADFFDVGKFPGKRGWMGSPGSYDSACEIAELASGVAPDKLYPLDLDLCTKKLDELRPNMVFYTSYPQIQQLLTSKTAAVVAGPSGQAFALKGQGVDVTISWNQAIVAPNVMTIPASAPNLTNIQALADVFNEPERQARFAKTTGYGPGNPDAFTHMDDATKADIVNSPAHTQIVHQNSEARAEHDDELLAWYTKWLAG